MSLSIIVALIALTAAAAVILVLRQTVAQSDAQRHQLGLLAAVFIVLSCTTLFDELHNYVVKWDASLIDLTRQTTMLSLIALGAAVVIIAGGIDLSAGSVMAFSATICATLMTLMAPEAISQSLPVGTGVIVAAITGTLIIGLLIGSLHAWLITEVGLPPFVATLGTLVGLRSLSRAIVENVTQSLLGGARTQINIADRSFRELSGAISGSVWNLTLIVAVISIVLWVLLAKTVTGRHLYALGGNEQAARLCGIQTDRVKWLAYCLSAVLAAIAGILSFSQLSVADPQTLARGYELNAIAAAVVGGCSLQGGVGSIPGTLLGALFLRVVIDGVAKIIKTGADVYEGLIVGVLVVFAVTFTKTADSIGNSRRRLFAGALGWVTIVNLTLLSGTMMALLGARLVRGRVVMDASWLAVSVGTATLCLLLIVRSRFSRPIKQRIGIVWAVVVIASLIGLDQAFPGIQRSAAVRSVVKLGGNVSQNADGSIVVDLSDSRCDDRSLKIILPRLKYFGNLAEIRISKTSVTDAGLDSIGKTFQGTTILRQLDVTETAVTASGLDRLKRILGSLIVRQ